MRLATIRTTLGTRAVRVDDDTAVDLGEPDVGAVLRRAGWRERVAGADGERHPLDGLDYAPLVTQPEKIICVGLNYRDHIQETGREPPDHPTLFAKYSRSLIGAHDPIVLPAASPAVDWEAELCVVVGDEVRHATPARAAAAIAGYTVLNDVSVRDFQSRTMQWLQGKTFESSTPVGPWLVTTDAAPHWEISCTVDGELMQRSNTAELVFDPVTLVRYVSTIITLAPGDLISTGTPGGVGHARKPPRYLTEGATMVTRVEGIGECRNVCVREAVGAP